MSRPTGKLRDMQMPTIADLDYHRHQLAHLAADLDTIIDQFRHDIRRARRVQHLTDILLVVLLVLLTR